MNFVTIFLAISGFVNGAGFLLLTFLVLSKTKKQRVHKIFILMCFSVTIWSLAYGRWLLSTTSEDALLWTKIFSIGSTLIPIFHLHWISTLLKREEKDKYVLIFGYFLTIILLFFNFSPLFIKGIEPRGSFLFWPIPGPLYHIYLFVCYIGLIGYGLFRLILNYKKVSVYKKIQIKFVFIGLFIGAVSGLTNFPLWYNINITPYANPLIIVNFAIYAYAMMRYRLMDIRLAFRRSFLKIILAGFAYGTFYGVSWLFIKIFGSVWAKPALISGIFIAITFAVLWPLVEKLTLKFSNKYVYASIYTIQDTISKLTRQLTAIVDLEKIAESISNAIFKVMNIKKVAILVKEISKNSFKAQKVIGFNEKKILNINQKCVANWLNEHKSALVQGEIALQAEDNPKAKEYGRLCRIAAVLQKLKVELILPLITRDNLIGFILLGEKKSADAYTAEDIKLLETLANQASIAIENALLYNHQEEIIAAKTRDLQEKNIHLQKLLKMRSEFLNTASHQLRTPVSVIRGYLSMFKDGDYDNNPSAQKTAVEAMFFKTQKLNSIINDILMASELDTKDFDLANIARQENISQIAEKVIADRQDRIKEKEIKFTFNKEDNLMVKSYERYLTLIIENLLDNAILYTPEQGSISITLKKEKDGKKQEQIKFEIKDTGIGIPANEQKQLFAKFKRAKNAVSMHTDGTGIGLFIVKKLVKSHQGGELGFTSQEGKGSTFWFSLPEYE